MPHDTIPSDNHAAGDAKLAHEDDDDKQAAGDDDSIEANSALAPGDKQAAGDGDNLLNQGKPPSTPQSTVPPRMETGMYVVNGSLFTVSGRLCIPTPLRSDLIREVHESDAGGHRGAKAIQHLLQARVYWPGMERDVRAFVSACEVCGDSKSSTTKHWGRLRPHMPPTGPFTHYSMDFIFGLPKEGGGPLQHDGICVVVDMFSKRVIAFPVWESSPVQVVAE